MPSWRTRKCPSCAVELPASDFRIHSEDWGARWGHQRAARRVCPECKFTAPTSAFKLVDDTRTVSRMPSLVLTPTAPTRLPWWNSSST